MWVSRGQARNWEAFTVQNGWQKHTNGLIYRFSYRFFPYIITQWHNDNDKTRPSSDQTEPCPYPSKRHLFEDLESLKHPPMIFYILLPHIHIIPHLCPYNFHVSVGASGDFERLRSHASQWDLPPRCEAWKLVIAGRRGGSQGSQGCIPRCHALNTLRMSRHFPIFQWVWSENWPQHFSEPCRESDKSPVDGTGYHVFNCFQTSIINLWWLWIQFWYIPPLQNHVLMCILGYHDVFLGQQLVKSSTSVSILPGCCSLESIGKPNGDGS